MDLLRGLELLGLGSIGESMFGFVGMECCRGYSSVSNPSSGEDTEASGQELTDAVRSSPSDSTVFHSFDSVLVMGMV